MDQNPGQDTNPPEYNTKQARKAGITAFVGTTIEWFDFYIYGTASALVLGPFFPDASPAVGTLAAFATFAVGFVARPVGGVVFGHFGDKFGRKNAGDHHPRAHGGWGTVGVGLLPYVLPDRDLGTDTACGTACSPGHCHGAANGAVPC